MAVFTVHCVTLSQSVGETVMSRVQWQSHGLKWILDNGLLQQE